MQTGHSTRRRSTLNGTSSSNMAIRSTINKAVTPLDDRLYAYLLGHTREPQVLRELRAETAAAYPERRNNQIAPEQGALLAWLVETLRVTRAVEVGVFTGYSALAVALAMPEDGRLVACDRDAASLAIARRAWDMAGMGHKVEQRLGPASDSLHALLAEGHAESFDLAFIDADKRGYAGYFEQLLRLVRRGGVIAVDNILWKGQVADPEVTDKATAAIRDFNAQLLEDQRVSLAFVPIGDGMALCTKRGL
ncbi:hypothetical protein WJX81_008655 [Elliptochloris bilobata]|uniref:Caffeoyl-CoA O-methyltransferase n=1 Tax=Elliptochloris bilobata TaxID=381761 RepID=A0AAW1QC66_9CHLO